MWCDVWKPTHCAQNWNSSLMRSLHFKFFYVINERENLTSGNTKTTRLNFNPIFYLDVVYRKIFIKLFRNWSIITLLRTGDRKECFDIFRGSFIKRLFSNMFSPCLISMKRKYNCNVKFETKREKNVYNRLIYSCFLSFCSPLRQWLGNIANNVF